MKTKHKIASLLMIALILFSCKKDKPIPIDTTVIITGKIVKNCAQDPLANRDLQIWVEYGVWGKNNIFEIKTDSNGNFNLSFTPRKDKYNVSIRPAGMGDILTVGPEDKNLGTIIATPTCNVVMKIKVNNPYSFGDTLRLKDFPNHPTLKGINIAGPFKDTILTPAYNYAELNWPSSFENKNTTFVSSIIYIYRGVSGTSSFEVLHNRRYENRFKSCTGAVDTVLIVIN